MAAVPAPENKQVNQASSAPGSIAIVPRDYLFVAALVLAPITDLRVGPVGPAEVSAIIWLSISFAKRRPFILPVPIVLFWLGFLFATLLGVFMGSQLAPESLRLLDLLTWAYLAVVACGAGAVGTLWSSCYVTALLARWVTASALVYGLLYLVSKQYAPTVGPLNLWFAETRFTAGADNPHQLALSLAVSAPLALWYAAKFSDRRWAFICIAIVLVFLGLETQSATLLLSWALVIIVSIARMLLGSGAGIVIVLGVAAVTVYGELVRVGGGVSDGVTSFIGSDPNGWHRLEIFASSIDVMWMSPLVGLGPGVHGLGGSVELHNTLLEILAMSGLIGLALFVWFFAWVLTNLWWRAEYLAVYTGFMAYGLAGFSARRLVFWLLLMVILGACVAGRRALQRAT